MVPGQRLTGRKAWVVWEVCESGFLKVTNGFSQGNTIKEIEVGWADGAEARRLSPCGGCCDVLSSDDEHNTSTTLL